MLAVAFVVFMPPVYWTTVCNSGVQLVMCGLDVTMKAMATVEDVETILATGTKAGKFIAEAFEFYINMYKKVAGIAGCAVHDAVSLIL